MTKDEIDQLVGNWLSQQLKYDEAARADTSFAEDRARRYVMVRDPKAAEDKRTLPVRQN
jgi:hypothetical protein